MKSILFVIILIGNSYLLASEITEEAVSNKLKSISKLNLKTYQKVEKWSHFFTANKVGFVWGPLGEGKWGHFDADPLYRFDAFDCTTFVETIAALARAEDFPEFTYELNEIRYKGGHISYVYRNHFPSADWIPNNKDVFKDITEEVAKAAGLKLATATAVIKKKSWYQAKKLKDIEGLDALSENERNRRLKSFQKLGENMTDQKTSLKYLPFSELYTKTKQDNGEYKFIPNQDAFDKIPSGVIVNTVSPGVDFGSTQMNVTHQGIVVRVDGILKIRHASYLKKYNRLVELDLIDYYQKFASNPKNHRKGIHLLSVQK